MNEATVKSPFTAEQEQILQGWTTYYPYLIMGLIEALRVVQGWHLCVTTDDELYLAQLFKTNPHHVHEVATFFPYFTQKPTGRKRIGLCHGLSCSLAGSDKMAACLKKTLGVNEGQTTPDGEFSFETMECLGACEQAPALQINDRLQGPATEQSIADLAKRQSS